MIPKITVAGDDPVNSCAEGPLPALSPGFGVKAENRFFDLWSEYSWPCTWHVVN